MLTRYSSATASWKALVCSAVSPATRHTTFIPLVQAHLDLVQGVEDAIAAEHLAEILGAAPDDRGLAEG